MFWLYNYSLHKELIHPDKSADLTVSVIEGKPDDFEEFITSDLNTVLAAAKTYFDFGVNDKNMVWEKG